MRATTNTDIATLQTIMRNYAMLLGLREREAAALAQSLADADDRPTDERQALARVEHAMLDTADQASPDKTLLSAWLVPAQAGRDLARLPQGAPAATGLPMPAQNLDPVRFQDIAQNLGLSSRPRLGNGQRPADRGAH